MQVVFGIIHVFFITNSVTVKSKQSTAAVLYADYFTKVKTVFVTYIFIM